jgi:hypothetical protein
MTRDKGSKRYMQDAVADRPNELGLAIGEALPALQAQRLTWVSPLPEHAYKEFKDGTFLEAVGQGVHGGSLREFWPSGGPNWDALATVDVEGGGVVLVEAKAHVGETPKVDRSRAGPESVARIASSMARTRSYLGVPRGSPSWPEHHYQVANRIAHLWWLNEVCGVPTWLVFLGFTDSRGWLGWPGNPLSPSGWRVQVAGWMSNLGLPKAHPLADRIGVATMKA